jgi:TonB family protein
MRRAIAATLLVAPLAYAADEAPKRTRPAPPLGVQALTAAAHEMQNAMVAGADLTRNFNRLVDFQHTPETAKLLADAFSNERPWSVEKRGSEQSKASYRFLLAPLHTTTAAGNTLVWDAFPIDFRVDNATKSVDYRGSWPSLSFEDKEARLTLRDGSLSGKQRRGGGDVWYGTMRGDLASMQFEHKTGKVSVLLRDLWLDGRVDERPRTVDVKYGFGIKAIEVAGERIDDFRMNMRLVNIDKAAVVAMRAAEKKINAKTVATSEDLNALMPLFKQLMRGAAKHKTALVVDEMSVGYHGHRALLSGRVSMGPGAGRADFEPLSKRIDARFTVKVPLALVREVAMVVVRQQMAAATMAQPQAPAQDAAALAAAATDAIVGKMLGNGYARLEDDALVSTIEFRKGVLRVNGKQIELPKPPKAPVPAHAAGFMQSRRIAESCTLPDYPAQAVAQNSALELTLEYVVDPNGALHGVKLAQPSGFPDYDQALLTAFSACRFIPALQDGKPVEHRTTYTLSREAGSVRP